MAQQTPATMDAAAVVLALAHLERYRERADPADLSAARTALGTVRVTNLDARDHIDFQLALGEALFFEDDYGAAALLFESPKEEADAVAAIVKQKMSAAVPLRVPLDVDVGIGENWKEAKS